jgi:hypothetical protein
VLATAEAKMAAGIIYFMASSIFKIAGVQNNRRDFISRFQALSSISYIEKEKSAPVQAKAANAVRIVRKRPERASLSTARFPAPLKRAEQ